MPLDNRTPEVRNIPTTRPEVAAEKEHTDAAHQQADQDIEQDAELANDPQPEDDLDEGELARFEDSDEGEIPIEE